jgi:DNA-binding NarL/FixJ family response regulator
VTTVARSTCLVADDHPALVAAVAAYLAEYDFEIVGPAHDGRTALALAAERKPDVALIDFRMPNLDGTELLRALLDASPETKIAVYTADATQELAREVLDAGAKAVVLKEAPLADIVRALRSVLDGRSYLDPALTRTPARGRTLTRRELDVLSLLAEGLAHEEIGRRLGISSETVRTHLRKASDRLGASTRTQAVASALRQGLIT